MRIGALARELGTTTDAIRFYEKRGVLPAPSRQENRYREYTTADAERLRLVLGLRQLDLPLDQAAELAGMCAEGRCDEVSQELRAAITEKRAELRRRLEELSYLDRRLAHLEGDLAAGQPPRPLITLRKEGRSNAET
jgi:MerR family transcriptional regulator, copper efflux regulator